MDANADIEQKDGELPNTFVDGRNALFLLYAAIYAKGQGINDIITGVCETDFSGYPDCRDVFIKSIDVYKRQASACEEGILLRGEKEPTKPAKLEVLDDYNVNLTISEGRYHQVKRMFAALGNKVVALHRWRIGNVELDESLEEGEFRPLSQEEIDNLVK